MFRATVGLLNFPDQSFRSDLQALRGRDHQSFPAFKQASLSGKAGRLYASIGADRGVPGRCLAQSGRVSLIDARQHHWADFAARGERTDLPLGSWVKLRTYAWRKPL